MSVSNDSPLVNKGHAARKSVCLAFPLEDVLHDNEQEISLPEELLEEEKNQCTSKYVVLTILKAIVKAFLLLFFLYFFICSLDLMSSAFRLLGGKGVGMVLQNQEVLQNPIAGLVIGILITVLVQSSSTSTSIIITMVGADLLTVQQSVYMVMGANVGTSVTNTIVSMGQITNKEEFRRSFAGATIQDIFNWLTVLLLLPIEAATGGLVKLTNLIVENTKQGSNNALKFDLLKKLTKPLVHLVVQLDSSIVKDPSKLATANTILLKCCGKLKKQNGTFTGNSSVYENATYCPTPCDYIFFNISSQWSDAAIGGILLAVSLVVLVICLVGLVKVLKSILSGRIEIIVKKVLEPKKHKWIVEYLSILVGMILTIMVQSSSVLTSVLTPLVGSEIISLEMMYPLTLGANIGTTITGLLAALASAKSTALQTALVHLFFNVIGIIIWFPIPFMRRVPVSLARKLGDITGQYRWIAFVYLVTAFGLLPMFFLGLSIANFILTIVVACVLVLFILLIVIINILQNKCPHRLPTILQNWRFIPKHIRSPKPIDQFFSNLFNKGKDEIVRRVSIALDLPNSRRNSTNVGVNSRKNSANVGVNSRKNSAYVDGKSRKNSTYVDGKSRKNSAYV